MDISYIILILLLITLFIIIYFRIGNRDMMYIKSDIDHKFYMVRDRKDKKAAANMLAIVKQNILGVTKYMSDKLLDPNLSKQPRYIQYKPYIEQLKTKIKNVVIRESSANTVHTSYTVNKGEQIVFCVRSKSLSNSLKKTNIHGLNLVMYVALHEISHVACPEYDHTPLFKDIFHFICEEAIEMNIYKKINFNNKPEEYCGMMIRDSII
jgi:hypothetical protein